MSNTFKHNHKTEYCRDALGSVHYLIGVMLLGLTLSGTGCRGISEPNVESDAIFELADSSETNIRFVNDLDYAFSFNIYRYRNFYNGGGVALGDINNDGLLDLYLTGNQVSNRLYLNKGDFRFEDITRMAGVAGERAWSTGVSMADVNGDGWLDIYVCNSGLVENDDKKNELFINNGDSTFTEMGEEYGIADPGLSTHGSFFDYDKDGDLDLYLVNNSYRAIGSFNLQDNTRHIRHEAGGDRLYRNELISSPNNTNRTSGRKESPFEEPVRLAAEVKGYTPLTPPSRGEPRFTDVSEQAGIYGSEIGFGLGVSVGDVNRDGWPDMYISNDFFERDYLYLNNRDGTFTEALEETIKSVSAAAMGSDMADLNGDGYPEIFVTDMLPSRETRIKKVTSFDSWERYQNYIRDDYYHQFTRNTLQLNLGSSPPFRGENKGSVHFSEVGRLAGVEASDWSWGAMIADYNLDGHRDIFVANGIYQDLTNADYLVEIRKESTFKELTKDNTVNYKKLIEMIPSNPIPNHMFAGHSNMVFTDSTAEWGLADPGFSNGSAYGDLDNDGDLDLVVNNVNMESFVYRNRVTDLHPGRAWLQVELAYPSPNHYGVGAQLTAWADGRRWYIEQQPVRGFQSTVDPTLHLGLGNVQRLDSLVVRWPDGSKTERTDLLVNRRLKISYDAVEKRVSADPGIRKVSASAGAGGDNIPDKASTGVKQQEQSLKKEPILERLNAPDLGLDWEHRENTFNDFNRQPLLFHMRSTEGPALCVGDANGDGREDFYVGGAKDQAGVIFVQNESGFTRLEEPALNLDALSEDIGCTWFDADGDGDDDLYVASGGSEFPASSSAMMDRLYFNDGRGRLSRSDQLLIPASRGFEPTGAVSAADYDGDGDIDLFVGSRMRPFAFGIPVDGHLLTNDGNGKFSETTDEHAPGLRGLGLITGARWGDVDSDGDPDLLIAGEWMPLTLFENRDGTLVNSTESAGLDTTPGWWNAVDLADLDGDGDLDLVGANHGLNSRFEASPEKPVQMWTDDFDGNGIVEQIIATYQGEDAYPMVLRHDLLDQLPFLESKYPSYESYAGETVQDIFSEEQLNSAVYHRVELLESAVGWNDGEGRFRIEPLPPESQLAPMYGIEPADLNNDGTPELLMGGNLYEAKPEVGRYDASFGVALAADSTGRLRELTFERSGFWVEGPIRNIVTLDLEDGRKLLLVARNDAGLEVFSYGE